jgi:hypothetical protein
MGWSIGFDSNWKRDIGYGVPAICDHPVCSIKIDRGLAYVCGTYPFGGENGCGLFFCYKHRDAEGLCERCADKKDPQQGRDRAMTTRAKIQSLRCRPWRPVTEMFKAESPSASGEIPARQRTYFMTDLQKN